MPWQFMNVDELTESLNVGLKEIADHPWVCCASEHCSIRCMFMSQAGGGLLHHDNQYATAVVPKVVHVPQGLSKIIYF